jgi:uncharacterized membrane protein YvbJ
VKKCPFCGNDLDDNFSVCIYCGKELIKKTKWYHTNTSLVLGFLISGPLILPLIWSNPNFDNKKKSIISIIVIGLTVLLIIILGSIINKIYSTYNDLLKQF